MKKIEIVYSKIEPKVCEKDVIVQNGITYIIGHVDRITKVATKINTDDMELSVLEEPYVIVGAEVKYH